MAQVTIYGFPPSTYVQSARLVCAEAGVEHELGALEFHQPSHYALHPFGKMPILEHGSLRVYETLAITSYVDDVFHAGELQPSQPVAKARMLQWASLAIDYGYATLVGGLHEPTSETIAAAGATLKTLDAQLSDLHLAGDRPSLADFLLYPMMAFALGKLKSKPKELGPLMAWYDRMSQRSSVKAILQ